MSQPPYPPQPEPAYDPAYPPQPTGPMDGAPPTPPIPPLPTPEGVRISARQRPRAGRAALTATVVGTTGLVLLVVGLSLRIPGTGETSWSAVATWSVFATLAALLSLVPHVPGRGGLDETQAWRVGAAGLAGVALFWLLVVALPGAGASNRGFVLTAALGLLAAATFLTPGRPARG